MAASILPLSSISALAQGDIVPVSDITGGSSVFVWPRGAASAAPKRFVTRSKTIRTKEAKLETARKITTQYERLARVAPRRQRESVIDPNDPRIPKIPTMPPDQASKLFTGVGEYYIDKNDSENAINFFREAEALDKNNPIAPKGLSEGLSLKAECVPLDARGDCVEDVLPELAPVALREWAATAPRVQRRR